MSLQRARGWDFMDLTSLGPTRGLTVTVPLNCLSVDTH